MSDMFKINLNIASLIWYLYYPLSFIIANSIYNQRNRIQKHHHHDHLRISKHSHLHHFRNRGHRYINIDVFFHISMHQAVRQSICHNSDNPTKWHIWCQYTTESLQCSLRGLTNWYQNDSVSRQKCNKSNWGNTCTSESITLEYIVGWSQEEHCCRVRMVKILSWK